MALKLKGSTSGFVGLDAPAVAGNNTLILPDSAGSAGQILANDITAGVTTFTQVTVSRNGDLTVPGTISIGGTLTYEDVTSIDSVGIITARSTIDAQGDVSIADKIIHTGDTNTAIRFPSADTITAETGGTERLRIKSDGVVGINTSGARGATLEIQDIGSTGPCLLLAGATNTEGDLAIPDGQDFNIGHWNNVDTFTERFHITSTGKIGINTDNPTAHLQVYRATQFGSNPIIQARSNHGSTNELKFQIDGDGDAYFSKDVGVNTDFTGSQSWRSGRKLEIFGGGGNVTGELHIGANRGDGVQAVGSINFFDNTQDSNHKHVAIIESDKDGSTANKRGGELVFYTKNDNVATPTEKMRIDSSGNVTKPTNFHILVNRDGNQTGYNASNLTDPVIWNRVITGESSTGASSHFNTSTGLFTAPVTGMYFFHMSVNAGYANQGGWLIINGSRPNYSAFYPNGSDSADAVITYHVTAGQTVGVKWYLNGQTNGTINANDLHTWWRIILLG